MPDPTSFVLLWNWQCHIVGSVWHSILLHNSTAKSAWHTENIPGILTGHSITVALQVGMA